jgi:superfamily II RNA helicase
VTATLCARLAEPGPRDADTLLEMFLGWAKDAGYTLYPHQEEAVLEIMADRHVVLNTPTGSGKSLVALAMHFRAFATGRRSFYTSPIKALVTEKFFELCKQFGPESVGMMTGDAALNRDAPIICCTAEVLSALALGEGVAAGVDYAILDEFHYYADRERGMAWQIPLLALPTTVFMLMSATLGDTRDIVSRLEARSSRSVAVVRSVTRPVPLEFLYSEEPLQEAVLDLVHRQRAPIYVVSFTQRECAELCQNFTSVNVTTREEKAAIAEALRGFKFDTPYGKDIQRFLRAGLAVHHAGLLPKYRLLVERLAQQGLLKLIFGTDTLGVGINVPLRTVVFTKLCKYDGQKTRLLTVRDFHQIAGRAGRKGYDDRGWVVCQAPEHVIENRVMERRAEGDAKKMKKLVRKKPPEKGYVPWDEKVYRDLVDRPPEALSSRFKVELGMLLGLIQRPKSAQDKRGGYGALIELIGLSHETDTTKARLRREAKRQFRVLLDAGVLEVNPRRDRAGGVVRASRELQRDFSLHHNLSLLVFDAVQRFPTTHPDYAVQVLSMCEAILEDPMAVLLRQQERDRRERLGELKAAGVEYEERIEIIEKITWPKPDADLLEAAYELFAEQNPWVGGRELHPKSVAREMYLRFATFNEYVQDLGLQPSEGVLLRHLSQVYKVLLQAVPEQAKNDEIWAIEGWLRSTLERTDSSLLQAWEAMVDPEAAALTAQAAPLDPLEPQRPRDATADPRAFAARLRADLHLFVKALARRDYSEAMEALPHDDTLDAGWLEERMRAYYIEYNAVVFDTAARAHGNTRLELIEPRLWRVEQVLIDDAGDNAWRVVGEVDLRGVEDREGPLVTLTDVTAA